MNKFCIFCGKTPVQRTDEHLIPKWLIELTGCLDRNGNFGPYYNGNNRLEMKKFSYKDFKFPACNSCNNEFGEIEGNTKRIMLDLLDKKPLDSKDFNLLLTWLDKMRIGSALSSLYLFKNLYDITPTYFINDGAISRDRMTLVYKSKYKFKCLNIFGIGTSFIVNFPICIGIIINNIGFINIAMSFLLHKAMGLPYPKIDHLSIEAGKQEFLSGTNLITYPIFNYPYSKVCLEIMQPIANNTIRNDPNANMLYNLSDYVKIFLNKKSLYGNIFYRNKSDKIIKFPENLSEVWIPPEIDYDQSQFQNFIASTTIRIQNSFLEESLQLSNKKSKNSIIILKTALRENNINLRKLPIL